MIATKRAVFTVSKLDWIHLRCNANEDGSKDLPTPKFMSLIAYINCARWFLRSNRDNLNDIVMFKVNSARNIQHVTNDNKLLMSSTRHD